MTENEIGSLVVDSAIEVHRLLGSGLLESVYEASLLHELPLATLRLGARNSICIH
jgi:GxxExxY protein